MAARCRADFKYNCYRDFGSPVPFSHQLRQTQLIDCVRELEETISDEAGVSMNAIILTGFSRKGANFALFNIPHTSRKLMPVDNEPKHGGVTAGRYATLAKQLTLDEEQKI
jgi:hypothetical protein